MKASAKKLKMKSGHGGGSAPRELKGKANCSVSRSHHIDLKIIDQRLELLMEALEISPKELFLREVRAYLSGFNRRSDHRGELEAVAYYKKLSNFAKRKLLADEPDPIPFTKTDRDNIPVPLAGLWKLSQICCKSSIFVQTVLNFYLGQEEFEPPPDFSTIEGPKDDVSAELLEEFRLFVKDAQLTRRLHRVATDSTNSLRISGSKGIYAQSFCSIPRERIALMEGNPFLRDAIVQMYRITGRDWLADVLTSPSPLNRKLDLHDEDFPLLRRMALLPEPGNKIRYITVADFFSQNALLPIHEAAMAMLKIIKQDATYTSSEAFEYLRAKSESSIGEFHCHDLKNFTDYLPVSLQMIIVREFFGSHIAVLWKTIIGQPIRTGPKHGCRILEFTRGQPMGLLSSWAIASLCHHYLVAWSQKRAKMKLCVYRLLGDDIVIWGRRAGANYLSLITLLRIPFSKEKTITSRTGFEFCKRRCVAGREITPVPLKALISKSVVFAGFEILRNYHIPHNAGLESVDLLVKLLNRSDPSFPIDPTFRIIYEERVDRSYDMASYSWLQNKPRTRKVMPASMAIRPRREFFALARLSIMQEAIEKARLDIGKLLKFQLSHLHFRERVKRGSKSKLKKIRGWIDKPTEFLGYLAIAQYVERMGRLDELVDKTVSSPTWNILGNSEFLELDIFAFDPRKRFENGRERTILDQIKTVRSTAERISKGQMTMLGLVYIAKSAEQNALYYSYAATPATRVDRALCPTAIGGELYERSLSTLVIVGKTIGLREWQVETLLPQPLNKVVEDLEPNPMGESSP